MLLFGLIQIIMSQIPDFHNMKWLSVVAAIMSFSYSFIGFALGFAKVIGTSLNSPPFFFSHFADFLVYNKHRLFFSLTALHIWKKKLFHSLEAVLLHPVAETTYENNKYIKSEFYLVPFVRLSNFAKRVNELLYTTNYRASDHLVAKRRVIEMFGWYSRKASCLWLFKALN